ncbi:MAG: hypothetical protein Q9194_005977 [Teloschistes cf. exilis]
MHEHENEQKHTPEAYTYGSEAHHLGEAFKLDAIQRLREAVGGHLVSLQIDKVYCLALNLFTHKVPLDIDGLRSRVKFRVFA